MGEQTPKRITVTSPSNFSPLTLPESPVAASPNKNLTGIPRTVRDYVADVYNEIQTWNQLHIKGASIVKQMASLKASNVNIFMSSDFEQLSSDLFYLMQSLREIKDGLFVLRVVLKASEKMYDCEKPIFMLLSMRALTSIVEEIAKAYETEYNVKQTVLHNLPYAYDVEEAMSLASMFTYQPFITDQIVMKLESMLVETGHRKIC